MTKIRVGIADDELLFIQGMKLILEHDPELVVTMEAENGAQLLTKLSTEKILPDVILLDIGMPVMDGVDALISIISMSLPVKIIMLTSHYTDSMIVRLLDEGASGFLPKNEHPDVVIKTIKSVVQSGFYINDHIVQIVRDRRLLSRKKPINAQLSHREIEILKLICAEFTNKEIAEQLGISIRTIEGHRMSILEKTDCKNIVGMVIYAIEHKIIQVHLSRIVR
ncbi:MAG: response regulator transcription factor [Saprospiraceae bacterium]|nr:response regulator transcription factor [Saprospiraceae bacterium]